MKEQVFIPTWDNQPKQQTVFGKWVVSPNGDLDYDNRLFARV